MNVSELESRIVSLQRKCNWLFLLTAILAIGTILGYIVPIRPVRASGTPEMLRVRELIVVDENGIERVIIGAPLPGQWENRRVNTKRTARPFKQAGILIFDKDGVERGGYLTDDKYDNALLTLDDKKQQEVLLVTGAEPTSSFRMWTASDSLELRVDPDVDGPSLRMIRNGKTVLAQPQSAKPR